MPAPVVPNPRVVPARARRIPVLLAVLALVAAGCSTAGSSAGASAATGGSAGASGTSGAGQMSVTGAWVRPAASTSATSAAYFTIANQSGRDNALTGVTSPAASMVQMHETTMSSGMMGMSPVDRVAVPAGGTVEFKPGGYHVMLMGLAAPLVAGSTVQLDLAFANGEKVTVSAQVKQG